MQSAVELRVNAAASTCTKIYIMTEKPREKAAESDTSGNDGKTEPTEESSGTVQPDTRSRHGTPRNLPHTTQCCKELHWNCRRITRDRQPSSGRWQ